jgi:carbon-monoxide dehydrogenase medium subunit
VLLRDRRIRPKYLLDLKSLPGSGQIEFSEQSGLTIGAAVSMNRIAQYPAVMQHYPVLADAMREVGSYQLRSRATLVGNLCNASPCGDTIGPCLVYDAVLHAAGKQGERDIALSDFFLGPGKTVLKPGEIVLSITLPSPKEGAIGEYMSIGRNKLGDLALAAVTVLAYPDKSCASGFNFRVTLSAVAPTVIFAEKAQVVLAGQALTEKSIDQAAREAMLACKPIDDIRSSAAYRRDMIRVLTGRALRSVCGKLKISL